MGTPSNRLASPNELQKFTPQESQAPPELNDPGIFTHVEGFLHDLQFRNPAPNAKVGGNRLYSPELPRRIGPDLRVYALKLARGPHPGRGKEEVVVVAVVGGVLLVAAAAAAAVVVAVVVLEVVVSPPACRRVLWIVLVSIVCLGFSLRFVSPRGFFDRLIFLLLVLRCSYF